MPQDAFHIRRLTEELQNFLAGGKINRISQVDKDELTFIIYTKKTTVKLILSANATGARVCLSAYEKEPAPIAPNFCMLLRKHLQNAEIIGVEQHEFERIVKITLHCQSDFSGCDRVLYCELMGKYSNIVLTEKDVILGALKTTALQDDSHRVLLPGAKYDYPAPQDKISILDEAGMRRMTDAFFEMHGETWEEEALAKHIFERVAGLALPTARQLAIRFKRQKKPLYEFLPHFCLNEPNDPHLQIRDGAPTDFFAFAVMDGQKMPSLCKAEDEFYSGKEQKKGFEDKKRKLEAGIRALKRKASKRLQDTLERIKEAERAEENRIKGELLTANLYRLEKGAKSVELENWYDEAGGTVKIALDETLSPAQNAQRYFKTYNKQKRTLAVLTPMQAAEEREIEYADSVFASIKAAEYDEDLKEIETELIEAGLLRAPKARAGAKKKEVVIPFRKYEHDGHTVLVGRNNLQNDRLLRQASPDDIWLHTQKYHSSHAIIVADGRQVRDETVLFAAEICAYYSDGREADKIPVDYCKRKFVKKPSKSKAGFVVYTDYKTILVKPDAHK
ncbi:MAG: NFACT family protein [Clostridia bacterium]|nr:NFACT family protein [Clostridia bacterium]